MHRRPLVVGILGGMGPMATVEAFRRITVATPAEKDQDHLHVIVDSDASIPNRTDAVIAGGPSPLPALRASANRLVRAGAGLICMPCNTAHVFFEPLQRAVPVPIVHMIEETAAVVARAGYRRLGLLATSGTVASGVYQEVFLRHGLQVVGPSVASQDCVSEGIDRIKGGRLSDGLEALLPVATEFGRRGIRTLIVGCTEISLVVPQLSAVGAVVDALEIMAERTVDYAFGRHRLRPEGPRDSASSSSTKTQ
jgi:aspartate racemase